MKTTAKFLKLLAVLCILFNTMTAQPPKADKDAWMEITGRIKHLKDLNGKTYKVELILNDLVIDSAIVQNNKKFKFFPPKDSYYAIRITKKGYVTRLISVYTQLPDANNKYFRLVFTTNLIEEARAKSLDKEALDFPIAIISYNKRRKHFNYNEKYTTNIKRSLVNSNKVTKVVVATFSDICPN